MRLVCSPVSCDGAGGGSIEPIPEATKAEILDAADLSEKMGACQLPDRPEFFKEVSDFIRANISTLCGEGGAQ